MPTAIKNIRQIILGAGKQLILFCPNRILRDKKIQMNLVAPYKLINAFLEETIDKETYLKKKEELIKPKTELNQKKSDFGQNKDFSGCTNLFRAGNFNLISSHPDRISASLLS